jgi:hypothetical protein
MHIYAFGSICRGEVAVDSDIDLLALVSHHDDRLDPSKYSIYSYTKMRLMWSKGSPFAWHLALEARQLFASDGCDFLKSLGQPSRYTECSQDCAKFFGVFLEARSSLVESAASRVFDLSSVFLSIRNMATCFALGVLAMPNFSRHSALALHEGFALPISLASYRIFERSRILCTRSQGPDISEAEVTIALSEFHAIENWMKKLVASARDYERVQQPGRCTATDTQGRQRQALEERAVVFAERRSNTKVDLC